jgi:hypothetical protein
MASVALTLFLIAAAVSLVVVLALPLAVRILDRRERERLARLDRARDGGADGTVTAARRVEVVPPKTVAGLHPYYIVGARPVCFAPTADGGAMLLKMSWETGEFEPGLEYLHEITRPPVYSDTTSVSEDEFIQATEAWRARNLKGDGTIFALYSVLNAFEDQAASEQRALREDERVLVEELRRQTYALFEQEHRAQGPKT